DRGETWTAISPDLTTNRAEWQKQAESGGLTPDVSGAENFTTIIAIAPSPKQQGVLWAGTDDGRLHVTQDGGKTWTSVEGNLRGVPANTWIPHVAPSPHDAGTAFVVLDDHRRSNWTPYVQKTTDFGKTWTSLATKNLRGYALAIVQDPVDPDLLFLGTEFGLWFSTDGGKGWMPWRHGVPTVSVMDLVIHPREHDLVIATHGRGLYVIDDIRPLRSLSDDTQKKPLHVYEIADAQQYRVAQTGGARFPGNGEYRGESRPYGALITYSLNAPGLPHPDQEKERERKEAERAKAARTPEAAAEAPKPTPAELEAAQRTSEGKVAPKPPAEGEDEGRRGRKPEAEIQILDGSGKVIRTFKKPAVQGVNRAVWDLKTDAFKRAPSRRPPTEGEEIFRAQGGPEVLPGTYKVRVKYGQQQEEGTVRVVADPRFPANDGARKANFEAQQRAGALQDTTVAALERIVKTRQDLDTLTAQLRKQDEDAKKAGSTEANKDLLADARKLQKKLNDLEGRLRQPENPKGLVAETDVLSKINYAQRSISSSWDAPTPAQLAYLGEAEQDLRKALADLNRLYAEDVPAFRAKVKDSDLRLLGEGASIEVK
ncbi:MAG TPA: hypothetical protein VJ725_24870, partial [Thermoanaerobaculia bacterium]|nr:hypothetical protein [Thermoanaerobaculia bacterium]